MAAIEGKDTVKYDSRYCLYATTRACTGEFQCTSTYNEHGYGHIHINGCAARNLTKEEGRMRRKIAVEEQLVDNGHECDEEVAVLAVV